ncbi:MAG: hypothetical protein ACQESG_06270 [Nanobdellota archaeon]
MHGEAFEWLVGVYLQLRFGSDSILPQAQLWRNRSLVHVDFYRYDEERLDGELYEVKWTGVNLDACVDKYFHAAQCRLNRFNSGENVNIDTSRIHRLNLIVRNDTGYRNGKAHYLPLEKLSWPLGFSSLWEHFLCLDDYGGFASDMRSLFMTGFEENRQPDIMSYLSQGVKNADPKHFAIVHADYETELEPIRFTRTSVVCTVNYINQG